MKWKIGLALLVVLAFVGKWVSITFFGPSDQEQIQTALKLGIEASRKGQAGSVVDKLARSFKVNGTNVSLGKVADFIRQSSPELIVDPAKASIVENEARLITPVTIKASYLGFSYNGKVKDVEFVFKKTDAMAWLVIPTHKWELEEVFVSSESINDAISGSSGF